MRSQTLVKLSTYFLWLALLSVVSGCSFNAPKDTGSTPPNAKAAAYLKPPASDCEIRRWYNYQVVAIPVINKRWAARGLSVQARAKKAFDLRHNARMNARFMMADKSAVKKLQLRDQKKYGNPNGPTFPYLVRKIQGKGMAGDKVYKAIIQSSSRTSPVYNHLCRS